MTFNRNTWATFWMVMAGYMLSAYIYFYMYADFPVNTEVVENTAPLELVLLSILAVFMEVGYWFVTMDDMISTDNKGQMFSALLSGVLFVSLVAAVLVYGVSRLYRRIIKNKRADNTSAHIVSAVAAIIMPFLIVMLFYMFQPGS